MVYARSLLGHPLSVCLSAVHYGPRFPHSFSLSCDATSRAVFLTSSFLSSFQKVILFFHTSPKSQTEPCLLAASPLFSSTRTVSHFGEEFFLSSRSWSCPCLTTFFGNYFSLEPQLAHHASTSSLLFFDILGSGRLLVRDFGGGHFSLGSSRLFRMRDRRRSSLFKRTLSLCAGLAA